ncbi:unnamed protein product [Phaeothamnion confervicola]
MACPCTATNDKGRFLPHVGGRHSQDQEHSRRGRRRPWPLPPPPIDTFSLVALVAFATLAAARASEGPRYGASAAPGRPIGCFSSAMGRNGIDRKGDGGGGGGGGEADALQSRPAVGSSMAEWSPAESHQPMERVPPLGSAARGGLHPATAAALYGDDAAAAATAGEGIGVGSVAAAPPRPGYAAAPGHQPMLMSPLQQEVLMQQYQHQHRQHMVGQPAGQATPPILRSVNGAGLMFCFFVLLWRSLHNYEAADQMPGGFFRYLLVLPAVSLFLSNVACLALTLVRTAPARQKRRMKAVLSLNILSESLLLAYNLCRLVFGRGFWVPREEYVGRLLVNVWFLVMCYSFTRSRWVFEGTPF